MGVCCLVQICVKDSDHTAVTSTVIIQSNLRYKPCNRMASTTNRRSTSRDQYYDRAREYENRTAAISLAIVRPVRQIGEATALTYEDRTEHDRSSSSRNCMPGYSYSARQIGASPSKYEDRTTATRHMHRIPPFIVGTTKRKSTSHYQYHDYAWEYKDRTKRDPSSSSGEQ